MNSTAKQKWIALNPRLESAAYKAFIKYAKELRKLIETDKIDNLDEESSRLLERSLTKTKKIITSDQAPLTAALRILTDLALQRWQLQIGRNTVKVCLPAELTSDPGAEKERIRKQESIKRDEQLMQPSVRKFVENLERKRVYKGHFVSIFSLMRDGRELAQKLSDVQQVTTEKRSEALKEIVDPYLQFIVEEESRCDFTGFKLQDIWRYFRHTWTTQYMSIPGRTMSFIVRDRAAPMHPVMGIGALSSPIMQIKERDSWLGWHPDTFLEYAQENPSIKIGKWLYKILNQAIKEIYVDDFIEEKILKVKELELPSIKTLKALEKFSEEHKKSHYRFAQSKEYKKSFHTREGFDEHWASKARTHLFRSKRAFALSELLNARMILNQFIKKAPQVKQVAALLGDKEGRKAVSIVLRKAKADRVGIAMADITICGAVAPYNPLLGGKLVAMLAASPEVVETYKKRYKNAESEIASSMAGRPIVRPADLVFLGTTSLYGIGSSQYNRIKIPADILGGNPKDEIRYLELGRSQAFGTSHYSDDTVSALVDLVHHSNNGQRVNSIFGEGVSPKLRKIRDGFDLLAFPSDQLLRHGRARIIYGVTLVRNTREYLLGLEDKPDYIFSIKGKEATEAIANWWRSRWLVKRIESDDVTSAVASHTLIQPIRHGARVRLPIDSSQLTLFDSFG